jgi:hypothetical protein
MSFRNTTKMELSDFLAIIAASVAISGTLAMLLAEIGFYSWFGWATLTISISLFLLIRNGSWRRFPRIQTPSLRNSVLLSLVIIIAALEFLRPFENVIGGVDTGIYFNTAVQIALHGSVVVHDPIMASLNQTSFSSLYDIPYGGWGFYGVQVEGFYIGNPSNGTVVPQFFYLLPSLMAAFYYAGGPMMALYFTPIVGLLSIIVVYAIVCRMCGSIIAAFSSVLLSLNFAQIYFSRSAFSDVLLQFLFFIAILACSKMFGGEHADFYASVFGLALGGMIVTRLEGWVGAIVLLLIVTLTFRHRILGKRFRPFLILVTSYGILVALSTWFLWKIYVHDLAVDAGVVGLMSRFGLGTGAQVELIVIGFALAIPLTLLAGLLMVPLLSSIVQRFPVPYPAKPSAMPLILLMTTVIYGHFALLSRGLTTSLRDLVQLSWYVGGFPGIAAGVIGLVIAKDRKRNSPLVILFFTFLIFYIFGSILAGVRGVILISPTHPWWARRFVAVVIPGLAIGVGVLSRELSRLRMRKLKIGLPIAIAFSLIILILTAQHLPLIQGYVEYDHVIPQIQQIASQLPTDSLILFQAGGYGEWIAPPLRFLYGMNPTPFRQIDNEVIKAVDLWLSKGRHVFILQGPGDQPDYLSRIACAFTVSRGTSFDIGFVTLSGPIGDFPTDIGTNQIRYLLYELSSSPIQSCTAIT